MTEKKGKFKELTEKYKKTIIFAMLAAGITLLFTLINIYAGDFFFYNSYDFMVKNIGGKEAKPHKDVVLLLIDENTMQYGKNLGLGRWPWSRNIYPEILKYINLTDPPRAIFFDILFTEPDLGAGNDAAFSAAIADCGNVYHNILLEYDSERKEPLQIPADINKYFSIRVEDQEKIEFSDSPSNQYAVPIPCLRADVPCSIRDLAVSDTGDKEYTKYIKAMKKSNPIAKGLSVASFTPESDGVYRRGMILFNYNGNFFPSMALSAIMAGASGKNVKISQDNIIQAGKYEIPVDSEGKYLVNFYREDNRIPIYSMSALLLSAYYLETGEEDKIVIRPEAFSDKIVIIGVSAVGGQDLKNTPIHKTMPGPEIHANIISNILQQNFIIKENKLLTYVIMLAVIIISIASVLFISSNILKIIILFSVISAYTGINIFLFNAGNYLSPFLLTLLAGVMAASVSFIYLSMTEGAEKRKYSKILGNMIDPHIVNEALKDLESLKKGGEKNITAFFSDVASFSTISEKLSSADLAALLNEYLSAMTVILKEHGGTLDKYIGDAVVGIFGAPVDNPDNAILAARASIRMKDTLAQLREKWTADSAYCPEAQQMHARIGLNTGIAKVGFMGTENLASYTMMGDTVNLAARLEAAGKDYGVEILVSESTRNLIHGEMLLRLLDSIRVKGKMEPAKIYELIGVKGCVSDNIIQSAGLYEEAFSLYLRRDWDSAIMKFKESGKVLGEVDKSAKIIISRCQEYKQNPPPDTWDGVFTRTHK